MRMCESPQLNDTRAHPGPFVPPTGMWEMSTVDHQSSTVGYHGDSQYSRTHYSSQLKTLQQALLL